MVANEVGEEFHRFGLARVGRNLMDAVGRFIEAFACVIHRLGLALHLRAESALDNVDDYRAGMAMRCGKPTRRIGDFDHRGL